MTQEVRVRLSRGSALRQTSQWQPIIGTPALVPVPRKTSSMGSMLVLQESNLQHKHDSYSTDRSVGMSSSGSGVWGCALALPLAPACPLASPFDAALRPNSSSSLAGTSAVFLHLG